jgi:hypothetical protein
VCHDHEFRKTRVESLGDSLLVLRSEPNTCSRICSCQSTREQQGSTAVGWIVLNTSIGSTYFLSISTGFNKSFDLFWEQRC